MQDKGKTWKGLRYKIVSSSNLVLFFKISVLSQISAAARIIVASILNIKATLYQAELKLKFGL